MPDPPQSDSGLNTAYLQKVRVQSFSQSSARINGGRVADFKAQVIFSFCYFPVREGHEYTHVKVQNDVCIMKTWVIS